SRLSGILNGIDGDVWDPARDPLLAARYSAADPSGKLLCKRELQRALGLPLLPNLPLVGAVSRLTDQKGFDLVALIGDQLLRRELQLIILGTGDPTIEAALRALAARHPSKVAVRIAYDETLAHRIEAGADLFLMPSRFEPCGLSQLYSLRYGTPPIVRAA